MKSLLKIIIAISALFALGASAALFDTLESVDTLTKVAAQRQKTDRSPAGKVTTGEAAADAATEPKTSTTEAVETPKTEIPKK